MAQLAPDGVLVVPLRTFGMTRSWALRRDGDRLVSCSQRLCGFVSMRGSGAFDMRYVDIAEGVHLRLDEGQQVDPDDVGLLLSQQREQAWAGVSLPGMTVLADLDLWLAARLTTEPGVFFLLTAQQEAVDAGIVAPAWRFGTLRVPTMSSALVRAPEQENRILPWLMLLALRPIGGDDWTMMPGCAASTGVPRRDQRARAATAAADERPG